MNKKNKNILTYLSVLLLSICIVLLPYLILIKGPCFYDILLSEKYSANPEYGGVVSEVVSLLRGKTDSVNSFTPSENSHMLDVRLLVSKLGAVFFLCLAIFLGLFMYSKNYSEILRKSGIFSFILIGVMFLCLIFFSFSFDLFHKLFFDPGTYSFNTLIVQIFDYHFFITFAVVCSIISFLIGLLLFYNAKIFDFLKTKIKKIRTTRGNV